MAAFVRVFAHKGDSGNLSGVAAGYVLLSILKIRLFTSRVKQ